MISIVYVSDGTESLGDEEIAALLRTSRENNATCGLTGLLLYQGGKWMQVLEGEEEQIDRMFGVIAADPRHENVRELLRTPIAKRQFPGWSMAYRGVIDESIREMPGYDGFLDDSRGGRKTWSDPTRAQWLLDWFRLHAGA